MLLEARIFARWLTSGPLGHGKAGGEKTAAQKAKPNTHRVEMKSGAVLYSNVGCPEGAMNTDT